MKEWQTTKQRTMVYVSMLQMIIYLVVVKAVELVVAMILSVVYIGRVKMIKWRKASEEPKIGESICFIELFHDVHVSHFGYYNGDAWHVHNVVNFKTKDIKFWTYENEILNTLPEEE